MQSVISAATNWWADGIGSPAAAPAAATRQPPAGEAEEESEEEAAEGESEASESEDEDEEEETKGAASLAEHADAPFAFLPADSDLEKLVIQHHRFRRETQVSLSQQTGLHLLRGRELTSGVCVTLPGAHQPA